MRLILASASPRRAELLTSAGIPFDRDPAAVDEAPRDGEPAGDYVLRVAREKAAAVSVRHPATADEESTPPILAADTVVVVGGRLLGKPADDDEAREMLGLLGGRVHEVLTGVVLRTGGREVSDVVTTRVRFLALTAPEINWYVSTGEPRGKAGAYAIQGLASRFVDWIDGSWSNVVGLPVATVYRLLGRGASLRPGADDMMGPNPPE